MTCSKQFNGLTVIPSDRYFFKIAHFLTRQKEAMWAKGKSWCLATFSTLISFVESYENGVKYHFRFEYIILNQKMSDGKFA